MLISNWKYSIYAHAYHLMNSMDQSTQPDITSFVLRFIRDSESDHPNAYRGFVRHIQSDEEATFTHWQDAVNFIQQFVPINTQSET